MAAITEPSGYVLEPIREGPDFTLYRGSQHGNPSPVLAVGLAAEQPSPQGLRRLEHEYSLAAQLDPAWAAKPLALTRHEGRTILVLKDPGGEPLDRVLERAHDQPHHLTRFLRIAIGLTKTLGQVHRHGLIHKDIKPDNVLVDDAGNVWLTGFGIASQLRRESVAPVPPEIVAGTLAYMEPEQTGRMNRSIDTRSDLYSLGVLLYQMFTGALPFFAADPLEWVHCHIARQPTPPGERASVPEPVSSVIMKLLSKNAEERYQQTVAIKLVKSGMDSREIVNRFRAERQILANLTHPNIAAILDGGSTEDGSPYIVMEYIGGQPITEFAGAGQLSVRERIQLFLPVCLAVHYAHQKLVIHRDIKPGNILVTAEGNPKLLDFGIAKLLADDSPVAQGHTVTGMRAMTPDYSSPEQIRGESLSTASDVYSLGVVLFELLTGSRPYSTKGLTPSQLEHLVCAGDRGKPSETAGLPNRLARELRGDLDNIVLMAMRTEPERRYKSAEQLAEDLTRYLNGQPVIARTDTPFYRAGKFFRRHRTGIAAILALAATMAAGTLVAAREARMAQARADEMQKLIESVVIKTNNDLMNLPQSTEVRAALLKNTIENLDRLAKEPGIPPKLLMEITGAYVQAGQVQGLRVGLANVGHEEEALRSMEKAV
jgi:serine/threonine protein kinase